MSPLYLMPPSAMSGMSVSSRARAASRMAVTCGHAGSGHHPRRADRSRTHAHLHPVDSERRNRLARLRRSRRCRPPGRRRHGALECGVRYRSRRASARAHCRAPGRPPRASPARRHARWQSPPAPIAAATRRRPRPSLQASGCLTRFSMSLTVMSPRSIAVLVHDRQLLDAMLLQDQSRLLERGPDRRGDQPVAGHQLLRRGAAMRSSKRRSRLVRNAHQAGRPR